MTFTTLSMTRSPLAMGVKPEPPPDEGCLPPRCARAVLCAAAAVPVPATAPLLVPPAGPVPVPPPAVPVPVPAPVAAVGSVPPE
ncbi:MAG: hypothetical protein ACLQA5_13680 [Solirubrobacteraceae bacterium]